MKYLFRTNLCSSLDKSSIRVQGAESKELMRKLATWKITYINLSLSAFETCWFTTVW